MNYDGWEWMSLTRAARTLYISDAVRAESSELAQGLRARVIEPRPHRRLAGKTEAFQTASKIRSPRDNYMEAESKAQIVAGFERTISLYVSLSPLPEKSTSSRLRRSRISFYVSLFLFSLIPAPSMAFARN